MSRGTLRFGPSDSESLGIYITGAAVYNAPERDVSMVTVPGRSGDLCLDNGRWKNIVVTYPAFTCGDLAEAMRKIRYEFGASAGYYEDLYDSYHPDEYRRAVFAGPIDVEVAPLHAGGSFNLVFNCKPQRYLTDFQPLIFTADGSLPDVDAYAGTPTISITGTGSCSIGDTVITISEADGPTVIDCDTMDCYNGNSENRNAYVSFSGNRFPEIYPGDGVSMGDMSRIEILPRWWRL